MLDNPNEVGISSIREVADAARVKPNTLVRLARSTGFDDYDDFRAPFREEIRQGGASFPDRARWLQSLSHSGKLGGLYADMVDSTLRNIEETFSGISQAQLKAAADTIWNCRQVFVLGVGVNSSNVRNFTYLASTGMTQFHAIPRAGSTAVDDLAWADGRDVLVAITCKPYRREVVEAVEIAREQGIKVIGISDSAASPVIIGWLTASSLLPTHRSFSPRQSLPLHCWRFCCRLLSLRPVLKLLNGWKNFTCAAINSVSIWIRRTRDECRK